jgi:AraC-like DNA-binding protein
MSGLFLAAFVDQSAAEPGSFGNRNADRDCRLDTVEIAMILGIFVGRSSADWLENALQGTHVLFVKTWDELASLMRRCSVDAVILDPAADGTMNLGFVFSLLNSYPLLPVFAYVLMNPESLLAIAKLARRGLEGVFVHRSSSSSPCFLQAVERAVSDRIALALPRIIETRLIELPPRVVDAVHDLFQRPYRYQAASDLALQANLPTRFVYRSFEKAGLPTPGRLVKAVKVLRGYSYLRFSSWTVSDVSKRVGYSNARIFSEHVHDVFGLAPSKAREELRSEEMLMNCVEWLYKPDHYRFAHTPQA